MDPLSDVLDLLDLRAAAPARLEAGGHWALSFAAHQHLKVGAVVAGQCWLTPEGCRAAAFAGGRLLPARQQPSVHGRLRPGNHARPQRFGAAESLANSRLLPSDRG